MHIVTFRRLSYSICEVRMTVCSEPTEVSRSLDLTPAQLAKECCSALLSQARPTMSYIYTSYSYIVNLCKV